ncbi:MAG: hypothetical protein OHK0046_05340 [Anaerolineae bacterium]
MQKNPGLKWHGLALLALVLLLGVFSVAVSPTAVDAQGAAPTSTPTDPTWRAFSVLRDAIEEERSVDLTIVQSYTFEQSEFINGIDDGCDADVLADDVRPVYFGWTFTVVDLLNRTYQGRVSFDLRAVAVCDQVVESVAATPSASGTPTSDLGLPAPVPGSGATGSFELGGHVVGLGTDTVEAMRTAGMTWVKKQLRFNQGDPGTTAQGMITDAKGKGFKILLGIVGSPAQMTDYNAYIQDYARFVGEVAALGPDAIEVWNEPNLAREWPEGQIDGARYTQLLAAAYNAIKRVNPNIIVISGAPAPTGAEAAFPGRVVNDDRFMQQMANAGAANYMDCVGLHYNEGIVGPSVTTGDPRDNFPTRYYGGMVARASVISGKPICWTELGYLSPEGMPGPLPPLFAWAGDVTVSEQAAWLADAARIAAQSGRVRLMIIWNVNFTGWDDDPQGGYAIIRPGGGCPACSALGTVMRR